MFTGIIETLGRIASVRPEGAGLRLSVEAPDFQGGVALGDSIAVDGVCLTVESIDGPSLGFRATKETLDRTRFRGLRAGSSVNLERSLAYGARVGGHLVSGHVDGMGTVAAIQRQPNDWRFTFAVPEELEWALIPKGSIAVDGISLTIVAPGSRRFEVAIVQFTLDHTTLGDRAVGDPVHLEGDLMGRWVAHLLDRGGLRSERAADSKGGGLEGFQGFGSEAPAGPPGT